jgi:catechol 2,3-dioxygenase-like lactoylglutathione lyase family enzyme
MMMAQQPDGIHHVAFMAADLKKHIAFFSDVMGCPLVALFDMHGVPGGSHAFLKLNDGCYFSIVQLPGIDAIRPELGVTHAGWGGGKSAAGTLQHLAFAAGDEAELLALRDRIRSHGVNVMGPLDHGFCKSIYFAGPDGMTLEVACATTTVDPARWIDPAVCARAGMTEEEVARFKSPAAFTGESPVPQPAYDPQKPHMAYPNADMYRAMLNAPDAAISAAGSYTESPVAAG